MKVNILGSEWEVVRLKQDEDPGLKHADGYADFTTRRIVVIKAEPSDDSVKDLEAYMRKVTRHEIVHAFFLESGLHGNSLHCEEPWATNEEMVDWFAFQGAKIYKAWEEANAL